MFEGNNLLNPRQVRGYSSIALDSGNLILGDSNYGRVFRSSTDGFVKIFETDSSPVYSLLNLEDNADLAAIGNKLYLIYCGEIEVQSEDSTTTTSTSTDSTTTLGAVSLTFPVGGEVFVYGQSVTITWESSLGLSELVSLELYKGDELASTINSRTTNDGTYSWKIPSGLLPGSDYSVKVTWLTPGESVLSSSGDFQITSSESTTTTTSTVTSTESIESTAILGPCRGIPILELPSDEHIVKMVKDEYVGRVLFITSKARILSCSNLSLNAYLTGERKIYAEVKDGFGISSQTVSTQLLYALYNRIAEVTEDKAIDKWIFKENPTAIKSDRIDAVFLSPAIIVKEDLGFWKNILWREDKYTDTEILICVRAGNTLSEMQSVPWDVCFVSRDSDRTYGTTGTITRSLFDNEVKGKYLQIKVIMTTDSKNVSPTLLDLSVTYSTKFALYFFTTKFSLTNDSDAKSGLLVANITEPQNTEIRFGISDIKSTDWNDYTVVPTDEFFTLDNYENIRVGIKMISYGDNVPEVAEFALMHGAEKDTTLNISDD